MPDQTIRTASGQSVTVRTYADGTVGLLVERLGVIVAAQLSDDEALELALHLLAARAPDDEATHGEHAP